MKALERSRNRPMPTPRSGSVRHIRIATRPISARMAAAPKVLPRSKTGLGRPRRRARPPPGRPRRPAPVANSWRASAGSAHPPRPRTPRPPRCSDPVIHSAGSIRPNAAPAGQASSRLCRATPQPAIGISSARNEPVALTSPWGALDAHMEQRARDWATVACRSARPAMRVTIRQASAAPPSVSIRARRRVCATLRNRSETSRARPTAVHARAAATT